MGGEQFRLCVGSLEEGYKVDNFVEVECGTADAPRPLVDEDGPTDGLTSIEALPLKNNRRAMKSVIMTGYAVNGETSFSCTGKGSLTYTADDTDPIRGRALRDLQTSTEVAVPSGAGGGAELLEGLFELNIEMDIPSNESSAPLSSSMTTTVAVIALGSILSVVSSMIL